MTSPSLQQLQDREALRDIIMRAAIALDTRRFDDWLDLCTPDVVLVVPFDPKNPTVCEGRDALRDLFGVLHQYEATTHFVGGTLSEIDGDRARTQTYCLAHHLQRSDQGRTNLRMAVRYFDTFLRHDGRWLMSRRDMAIDWTELAPSPEPQA